MTDSKLKAAILIVSETASRDPDTDKCIPILKDVFSDLGNNQWEVTSTGIVPDSVLDIQKSIQTWTDGEEPVNLIVTSGGTGFATKDVTPEVCYDLGSEVAGGVHPCRANEVLGREHANR